MRSSVLDPEVDGVDALAVVEEKAEALSAAEQLSPTGIEVEVIDLRTLWPWDKETVMESVLRPELLAELAEVAHGVGLVRLGVVRLDHPGFAPAREHLDHYLREGWSGEMDFIGRSAALRRVIPRASALASWSPTTAAQSPARFMLVVAISPRAAPPFHSASAPA